MNNSILKSHPYTTITSLCIAILVMHQTIGAIPHISTTITFLSFVGIIMVLVFREIISISKMYLWYIIYLAFSLLTLNPPSIFSPWTRLAMFIIILIITSSFIENSYFKTFRRFCLNFILVICIIISIISFLFYFSGINLMSYTADLDFTDKGGLFSGLANHSIVLGIVSGISTCVILFLGIVRNWRWYILLIPCIGSLLLSASRGAVGATFAGIIVIYILTRRRKITNTKLWLLILIAIPSLLYVNNNTNILDGIRDKNQNRNSGIFDSREDKINYRIEEFKSSPIIGIGISTISINLGDEIDYRTGRIEPGSSWFSILSMTGIIGLIFFIQIIIRSIRNQISNKSIYSILLIGLMSFFIINLFSEGYIFAAGSPLCFIFWLLIGNCSD